jgi:hypothetical protein
VIIIRPINTRKKSPNTSFGEGNGMEKKLTEVYNSKSNNSSSSASKRLLKNVLPIEEELSDTSSPAIYQRGMTFNNKLAK